jgi:chromosome segregation and condensation protein ScpB
MAMMEGFGLLELAATAAQTMMLVRRERTSRDMRLSKQAHRFRLRVRALQEDFWSKYQNTNRNGQIAFQVLPLL